MVQASAVKWKTLRPIAQYYSSLLPEAKILALIFHN